MTKGKNVLTIWNSNYSSFPTPTLVGGDIPFHLKFAVKITHPFEKRRLQPISTYNVSTVIASEKSWIIVNRKSTTRFPESYKRSAYTYITHIPQIVAQKANISFLPIKINFNWITSTTKFLCVKTSSGKVVVEPFPYVTVYIGVGDKRNHST